MDRRIELIISKIKKDTAAPWDIRGLATLVNLSPSRFRHLFKQETGTTPAQYLRDFRLGKAERMLRTTFLSIKQILELVGITSSAHFVRDFRRKYGTTPTAYRRTLRRKRQRARVATFDKK
jgi:AraC family transcriptional regulator of arabinose operon